MSALGGTPAAAGAPERSSAAAVPLLRVDGLCVDIPTEDGVVHAVDDLSFELAAGRTLGIVGESGAGKTAAALSLLGLTRADGARVSGRVLLGERDLLALAEPELRAVRGGEVAMIFQDPLSALHPLYRAGAQVMEAVRRHHGGSRAHARARAVELLAMVGIGDPRRRAEQYPHELSGGTRQRVMIAMALAGQPRLLLADEPTTALDVTVQRQILELLWRLQSELGMAIVLISHDLGVVAQLAHDVAVMYAGRIVERGPAPELFLAPEHPYTWGLIGSMPTLAGPRRLRLDAIPGAPPSLIHPPPGCRFHPRCPHARPEHARIEPALEAVPGQPARHVACLLEPALRQSLWRGLRGGEPAEPEPAPPAAAGGAVSPGGPR